MASADHTDSGEAMGGNFGRRLATVGDAVMIRHTLFSLPFALAAVLLETGGHPPAPKLLWIIMAATGARNAANAN